MTISSAKTMVLNPRYIQWYDNNVALKRLE